MVVSHIWSIRFYEVETRSDSIYVIIVIKDQYLYPHQLIHLLFFREIAAASGEWVNEFIPNNGKKKTSAKLYVPSTAELLKRNIKRSWTISSE